MPCAEGRLGPGGSYCREIECAPQTPEGRAVADLLDQFGIWKTAGLAGAIYGLDIAAALALLPSWLDLDFARELLAAAERPFVGAWTEINKPPETK